MGSAQLALTMNYTKLMRQAMTTLTLETKDILIIACIFASGGHVYMTLILLILMCISAHKDDKKRKEEERHGEMLSG